MEEYANWTDHPEVSTAKAKRIHAADAETMMAEGNGDKLVQATPRERSRKYPSDATVTKEYCQNTAEAGASDESDEASLIETIEPIVPHPEPQWVKLPVKRPTARTKADIVRETERARQERPRKGAQRDTPKVKPALPTLRRQEAEAPGLKPRTDE